MISEARSGGSDRAGAASRPDPEQPYTDVGKDEHGEADHHAARRAAPALAADDARCERHQVDAPGDQEPDRMAGPDVHAVRERPREPGEDGEREITKT